MTLLQEDLKSALVGVTTYPLTVPEDVSYPCCTYQKISKRPYRTHSENVSNRYRYQISVYGETCSSCANTVNTVIGLLDLNKTAFSLVTLENEVEIVEAESGIYTGKIDFFIWSSK